MLLLERRYPDVGCATKSAYARATSAYNCARAVVGVLLIVHVVKRQEGRQGVTCLLFSFLVGDLRSLHCAAQASLRHQGRPIRMNH